DEKGTKYEEPVQAVIFTTLPPKMKETLSRHIGYIPPQIWPGAVFDIQLDADAVIPEYHTIHKFFIGGGSIHTIDLIPRGNSLAVIALGKGATLSSLYKHIEHDRIIQTYLPPDWRNHIIEGSAGTVPIPVNTAHNAVWDGIAGLGGQVLGETLFHGGLYSNVWAADLLVKTIKSGGFSKENLIKGYAKKAITRIKIQNFIGKMLYIFTDRFMLPSPALCSLFLSRISFEQSLTPKERIFTRFVWDLLIGEEPFSKVLARIAVGAVTPKKFRKKLSL
ncbi:MAG: hypothetical protein V1753_04400, partial [Pseudomonadota bacterium]